MEVKVPRDRTGTYAPILLPKHSRTFGKIDEQILTMYARGMTTRDIEAFVRELYGVEISADYVSTVTDRVLKDIDEWQNRPLAGVYPVAFFDALRVKIRNGATIKNMAVHLGIGIRSDGTREVLGMWIGENEGASFWAGVFNGLKARGVEDVLIIVTDGLKGMTEAIETSFPEAMHQTCIVHLIRAATALCACTRPQGRLRSAQGYLSGRGRRSSRACFGGVRGFRPRQEVPECNQGLAPQLGAGGAVLQLRTSH